MKKKILVALKLNDRQKDALEQGLLEKVDFTYIYKSDVTAEDVREVHGIIGNVSPGTLKSAKKLEWMQLNSAGADAYTVPGILPSGCILKNAVGAYGRAVSEHMIAMTFALVRKIPGYHTDQLAHIWSDRGKVTSVEGSTVLVCGLGDIGGSYARKMKALGAYVIGIRKSSRPKPEYLDEQYQISELPEIIGKADIIASVLPGTADTAQLFDRNLIRKMKSESCLINCGRGSAVDLAALQEALDSGHLSGAALDVTDPEPLPADSPLWDYDNVLITPHIAGGFHLQQTYDRILEIAGQNLREWIAGF